MRRLCENVDVVLNSNLTFCITDKSTLTNEVLFQDPFVLFLNVVIQLENWVTSDVHVFERVDEFTGTGDQFTQFRTGSDDTEIGTLDTFTRLRFSPHFTVQLGDGTGAGSGQFIVTVKDIGLKWVLWVDRLDATFRDDSNVCKQLVSTLWKSLTSSLTSSLTKKWNFGITY